MQDFRHRLPPRNWFICGAYVNSTEHQMLAVLVRILDARFQKMPWAFERICPAPIIPVGIVENWFLIVKPTTSADVFDSWENLILLVKLAHGLHQERSE